MYISRLAVTSLILAFSITVCHGVTRLPPSFKKITTPTTVSTARTTETPLLRASNMMHVELATAPAMCLDAISTVNPLGRLRDTMQNSSMTRQQHLDAYLIFYSDEHLSDEPAPEERRLEYISGWRGAGVGAVTVNGAAVWVPTGDVPRAIRDLSCAWRVIDADDPSQPTIAEWIAERIKNPGKVGGDARLVSQSEWEEQSRQLLREDFQLMHVPMLVEQLWKDETMISRQRPEPSKMVAYLHKKEYIGGSWRQKVAEVRAELQAVGADAMVVTALDEVAWLLNIRGRDVPHAPLLRAFVVVGRRDLHVYVPPGKLPMPVRETLAADACLHNNFNCTQVHDYGAIYTELRWRSADWQKVLVPTGGTFQRGASAAIAQSIPQGRRMSQLSPIVYLKAQKNAAEAAGMMKAHLRDAVAMCTLLNYLETTVRRTSLDEMSVSQKVDATRETQAGYVGFAMETRVAFGSNGADPYYRPDEKTNSRILNNSTLIISSGGQYHEGTTMVTRSLHFGGGSWAERRAYTSALRSLAALGAARLPTALSAAHADPVARAPLWAAGHDYMQPTGHGIGAALCRKEDPVVIDYRQDTNLHPFKDGYFVTHEPSWYEVGLFGVRLGNVLQVMSRTDGYLAFKEATLVPFEPKLIDRSMLTDYELTWLNKYNERIRQEVGPELQSQGLQDAYYWMMNKTVHVEPYVKNPRPRSGGAGTHQQAILAVAVTTTILQLFH